jgi:S1-C subfamily serine protease
MRKESVVRPYLGMKVVNFIPDKGSISRSLSNDKSTQLLIVDVDDHSPASNAGLQKGDLIKSINGKNVRGVRDLFDILGYNSADQRLHLVVQRQNGDVVEIDVVPGKKK